MQYYRQIETVKQTKRTKQVRQVHELPANENAATVNELVVAKLNDLGSSAHECNAIAEVSKGNSRTVFLLLF